LVGVDISSADVGVGVDIGVEVVVRAVAVVGAVVVAVAVVGAVVAFKGLWWAAGTCPTTPPARRSWKKAGLVL
jgi:hypothetical protein